MVNFALCSLYRGIHLMECFVGPTAGLNVFGEGKNLLSLSEIEPRTVQPSHYTDYAIAAPQGFCYTHETQIRTTDFRVHSQHQTPSN
jgi:hypothetical protein